MATLKKSVSQDRKRISSRPQETKHVGRKVGAASIKSAKKTLVRKTSRSTIMAKAQKIMGKKRTASKTK